MMKESEAFIEEVFFHGTGTLSELLTADYTMASQDYAQRCSTKGARPRAGVRRSPASLAAGILHQGAFLSVFGHNNESAPVLRGVAILRRRFAKRCPSPPAALMVKTVPPPPDPNTHHPRSLDGARAGQGLRRVPQPDRRYRVHVRKLRRDGRPPNTDNNKNVNTATDLEAGTDIDGKFANSLELVSKLGETESVRECFSRNLFRFASAQNLAGVEEVFVNTWNALPADAHGNLTEALVAYAKSPLFVERKVQP